MEALMNWHNSTGEIEREAQRNTYIEIHVELQPVKLWWLRR